MLHHTIALSGLFASASLLLATPSTHAFGGASQPELETLRLQHFAELAAREAVWSRLFAEGPSLAASVIYLQAVLDDASPWSHTLSIVDAQSGAALAEGGFLALRETLPMPLALSSDAETALDGASAFASLVRGEIVGSDGSKEVVVGARIAVEIADLSLIVPVRVEAFVPLSFALSEDQAEALFDRADLLTALADLEDGADPSRRPGAELGRSGGAGTPIRRQSEIEACRVDAWRGFAHDLSESWSASGIASGNCLAECLFSPEVEPNSLGVDECLPGCGLGALASGEGLVTWAWSAFAVASSSCEAGAIASSGGQPAR